VFLLAPFKGFDLSQVPETLSGSCGRNPGNACRLVWDVSHNGAAAKLTAVYLAGPLNLVLRLAWLVFLALVARALVHRLINRITEHAADAPLANRLRPGAGTRAGRMPWRRRPRAAADLPGGGAETTAISVIDSHEAVTTAAIHEAATERRHQRAHALGSILRSAASVTIFAIAGTAALGDLGVNLAPVLASAGVVGVAVGFGAQGLVRDFLAGIFMLLEDQYGVGDVINIGDATTGTVEAVSLRTTRLRDVNGVVWHLRNGALEKIGNESQGWARAVVDVPIPLEWDIPGTRQLMENAVATMWRDRHWRKIMLEKPEVWGAQNITLTDSKVVMRVAAKTLPLRQWEVARELRERVLSALDTTATPVAEGPEAAERVPVPRKPARRPASSGAGRPTPADTAPKTSGPDTERDGGPPDLPAGAAEPTGAPKTSRTEPDGTKPGGRAAPGR
jgi:small conductance mechanosensitive channel